MLVNIVFVFWMWCTKHWTSFKPECPFNYNDLDLYFLCMYLKKKALIDQSFVCGLCIYAFNLVSFWLLLLSWLHLCLFKASWGGFYPPPWPPLRVSSPVDVTTAKAAGVEQLVWPPWPSSTGRRRDGGGSHRRRKPLSRHGLRNVRRREQRRNFARGQRRRER